MTPLNGSCEPDDYLSQEEQDCVHDKSGQREDSRLLSQWYVVHVASCDVIPIESLKEHWFLPASPILGAGHFVSTSAFVPQASADGAKAGVGTQCHACLKFNPACKTVACPQRE